MAERPEIRIEPLLYENEAAARLGISPRALRSEREAGRIAYRKVAGRVMYRADDLTAWQENIACPARPRDRNSAPASKRAARSTSTGQTPAPAAAGSVQRALASAQKLIKSSRNGSTPGADRNQDRSSGTGHVVLLKRG